MENIIRKPRKVETAGERDERNRRAARTKIDEAEAADDAVDATIRSNIELYGP